MASDSKEKKIGDILFSICDLCVILEHQVSCSGRTWRVGVIHLQRNFPVMRLKPGFQSLWWDTSQVMTIRLLVKQARDDEFRDGHLTDMKVIWLAWFLVIDENGGTHNKPIACYYSWSAGLWLSKLCQKSMHCLRLHIKGSLKQIYICATLQKSLTNVDKKN